MIACCLGVEPDAARQASADVLNESLLPIASRQRLQPLDGWRWGRSSPRSTPGRLVEVVRGQRGQRIRPLVARIGGVAAHPAQLELDRVRPTELIPGLPEIQVRFPFPGPLGDLEHVLRVAECQQMTAGRHEQQR